MNEEIKMNGNNPKFDDIEWDFIAESTDKLVNIGYKLIKPQKQTFRDEQWQFSKFIKTAASLPIFEYPVKLKYTGDKNMPPDFLIKSGGNFITVELARVSTQDLEHARFLQIQPTIHGQPVPHGKWIKHAIDTTELLRPKSKPRTVDEIIDTVAKPALMLGMMSHKERREIFTQEVTRQLNEKTSTFNDKRFEHGHENWLVLRDRIGTGEFEVQSRIEILKILLAPYWKRDWYSRVFIQQIEYNPYLATFTPTECALILNSESATHKYPLGFF